MTPRAGISAAVGAGEGLGRAAATRVLPFVRLDGAARSAGESAVAEEVPVGLVYNGRPHAVMLATPTDLEDFAVGFTLAEAIVAAAAEIEGDPQVVRVAEGIELQLVIPEAAAERLDRRTRRLVGRTGCGLCGVEQIAQAVRLPDAPVPEGTPVDPTALWRAAAELEERQPVNRTTRAVHAAAFASRDGQLRCVREDVGRHNALDKLIGALARAGEPTAEGFVVVTSRASVEMVQKAATAGVPLLAAVSRPTALAVRVADVTGVTLVGLLRGNSANIYTHARRVLGG
jgi:FdhD protein